MRLADTTLFSDANLQAYYKFDSGALTTDSKNSNTLTNVNTVASGTGLWGGSADFGTANSSKYMHVGSNLSCTNKILSMGAWIKVQTEIGSGTWDILEHVDNTADNIFEMFYDFNGGTRRLQIRSYKVGTDTNAVGNYNITLGTSSWYHVCYTSDATTGLLYVNGVQQATVAIQVNGSNTLDDRFIVGANFISTGGGYGDPGPNRYASIFMDEAFFFNRKLSAAEVALLAIPPAQAGFLMNFM